MTARVEAPAVFALSASTRSIEAMRLDVALQIRAPTLVESMMNEEDTLMKCFKQSG